MSSFVSLCLTGERRRSLLRLDDTNLSRNSKSPRSLDLNRVLAYPKLGRYNRLYQCGIRLRQRNDDISLLFDLSYIRREGRMYIKLLPNRALRYL
jgi:hypothetical protein